MKHNNKRGGNRMDLFTARAARRKTQWDVTVKTGIRQSKISLMERGYIEPNDQEKAAIADALGFPVNEIDWTQGAAA